MNGIDKITQRIGADTQAEIDRILADAAVQAEAAADKFRTQAEAEDRDLLAKSERAAAEREERLVSAAQMEARKTLLTAKQEMVERAYQRALEKLRSLPQEQYVELLAALLVRASSTGREEVVFSPEDREGAGKAAVARANELLAKEAAPELPLGDGVVANLLNKVAAGVSAFAQGTAMLAVSEETRDISGGFILKDGRIEVNCTFDALVRAEREQTAGEVAKLLFPEAGGRRRRFGKDHQGHRLPGDLRPGEGPGDRASDGGADGADPGCQKRRGRGEALAGVGVSPAGSPAAGGHGRGIVRRAGGHLGRLGGGNAGRPVYRSL